MLYLCSFGDVFLDMLNLKLVSVGILVRENIKINNDFIIIFIVFLLLRIRLNMYICSKINFIVS